MARPPSTVPAPTLEAYYMRAYRAWRAGRGKCPGPRAGWISNVERLMERERQVAAEREWSELRDRVLGLGGIAPNADYSADSMPRAVYRLEGKPADVMAQLLGYDSDADLLNAVNWAAARAGLVAGAAMAATPYASSGERDYSEGGAW